MKKDTKVPILLLALYSSGIIIGGGILALPFTALNTGVLGCILLLVGFAIVFNYTYWRILGVITDTLKHVGEVTESLYDLAIDYSGLGAVGKIAFDLGLLMYTIPADFVYILYGSKSMCELHELLPQNTILYAFVIWLFICLILSALYVVGIHLVSMVKISAIVTIWLLGILISRSFYSAVIFFSISLLFLRYFPEKFKKPKMKEVKTNKIIILPHHESSAWFTLVKILLICATPIAGLILVFVCSSSLYFPDLFPQDAFGLISPMGVILFMYVGTGIYNILIYDWIRESFEHQKKISLLAIIISLMTYLVFTLSIIFSVDVPILIKTNAEREHALMAMSEKLRIIGLTLASYLVIVLADLFAMLSVSVAFVGFTDSLSNRFKIRFKINENIFWVITLAISAILVSLSEVFHIVNAATDALGFAGAAGGGLFILILPWLLRTNGYKRKLFVAFSMFLMCLSFNLIATMSSATLAGRISGLISSVILIISSGFLFKKALK